MSISHWRRTQSRGVLDADLLIIGAGVCGLSAAIHAKAAGLRVVIVERHFLGSGASSRNAGFLMRGAAENYAVACRVHGARLAYQLWRWTEENLALLRELGVESLPGYRRIPSVLAALEPGEKAQLIESKLLMERAGFNVAWIDCGDDAFWRHAKPLGGLVNPEDASCNPVEVLAMLRGHAACDVLEGQEATAFGVRDDLVEIVTTDAIVRAPRVLLSTNAYAGLLAPGLGELVVPRRGQMIAFAPSGARLDASYYANEGYEYFRQAADGTIVVGGCRKAHAERESGYGDGPTPWVQRDIERFAREKLALTGEVLARWAGTMGFSPDGVPMIGPVPPAMLRVTESDGLAALAGRVWFCGGFTGHGMSLACRCAKEAVEAMLASRTPAFPLARFSDAPARSPAALGV
ncbi:MAG: FAD-binding oxidoreductase [Phycisphaerales bacterium]|jgi:glycine/D-amino acid oxidase-like deaminating enzyme|nr:FAD-binding oxidoreductase [Phycisphaerales bacterium]